MSYTNGLDKPSDYFNTVLYTGTGATQSITGVNFQPDFVWIKDRGSNSHRLTDSVRGATKILYSDLNFAEVIDSDTIQSFDSDGFTLAGDADTNGNGLNFASWNWLAGGTAVSNTDGSITSQVSANTTSGFSIVSYTGTGANATVGHGLGSAPNVVIIKRRNSTGEWVFGHSSLGFTKFIEMNSSGASQTNSTRFNDTAPTSSVFSIGTAVDVSTNGGTYIAYCFAEKKGFSKFGKYDGNAGVGAFVNNFQYLGFKPSFVMIKCYNAAESWNVFDNKRNGYNYQNNYLIPNTADTEVSAPNQGIDLLSNGFNPYYGTGTINRSGKSYIYMAFAENPFTTSTGIPTTAR